MTRGRFAGRVVVVTGAARGVGRRSVELFLDEGAQVVAVDQHGLELATLWNEAGDRVERVTADISTIDGCEAAIATASERYGRLDVLFNNGGITVRAPLEATSDALWSEVLDTNLRSAFVCSRSAIPLLKQSHGVIVNNASINAIRGNLDLAAYSAAKGGLVAMTRALATEFATDGIRVNAICPGTLTTPMTDEYLETSDDQAGLMQALIRKHPLGRLGSADDVAHAALFLASDESAFITGVTLPVDGGRHLV